VVSFRSLIGLSPVVAAARGIRARLRGRKREARRQFGTAFRSGVTLGALAVPVARVGRVGTRFARFKRRRKVSRKVRKLRRPRRRTRVAREILPFVAGLSSGIGKVVKGTAKAVARRPFRALTVGGLGLAGFGLLRASPKVRGAVKGAPRSAVEFGGRLGEAVEAGGAVGGFTPFGLGASILGAGALGAAGALAIPAIGGFISRRRARREEGEVFTGVPPGLVVSDQTLAPQIPVDPTGALEVPGAIEPEAEPKPRGSPRRSRKVLKQSITINNIIQNQLVGQ